MLKKLRLSTFGAAYRMGGYIGWCLTVMFICEQSLHYYRDDNMLSQVNVTFLTAAAITSAVIAVVLLLLDFEGLLSDRLLRWLPGAFMAESGIALSLANAETMRIFAAIAGIASALGLLAVMSRLLKVKVGQRSMSIGLALAIGSAIRLTAGAVLNNSTQIKLVVVSVVVGIIALLTVHSDGFSRTDGPLVSLPEAEPLKILSKLPHSYLLLFICTVAYFLTQSGTESAARAMLPSGYGGYYYFAFAGFLLTGICIAAGIRMTMLPLLAVFGTGFSAAATLLARLPYFSAVDASFFAILSYVGLACFEAAVYLFIIIFSLDRPHPLFFSAFGSLVYTVARLTGSWLSSFAIFDEHLLMFVILLLIPVSGIFMYFAMKHNGFTTEQLARRHITSELIKRSVQELELTDRQRKITELIVLDRSDVEELSLKLLFSRNTVRALLRPIFEKYAVEDIEQLRDHFNELVQKEEHFKEQIRTAEESKRAEDELLRLEMSYEQRRKRVEERIKQRAVSVKQEDLIKEDINLYSDSRNEPDAKERMESIDITGEPDAE